MEKYKFNKELLKVELESLSHSNRIAFSASCCDRMLPNYIEFSKQEQWGDYKAFQHVMNEIWNHVLKNHLSSDDIKQYLKKCEELTPHEDDFNSIYVSFAVDAGSSLYNTLKYCLDGEIKHLLFVADYSRATVDLFIQEKENMHPGDPELEEKILNNPLMVRELIRQQEDIDFLKTNPLLDQHNLATFRSRNNGETSWIFNGMRR